MGTWPPEIKENIDIDMRVINCFSGEMVASAPTRRKGNGAGKGSRGQARRKFSYGLGCSTCPDCFICPKPDCDWQAGKDWKE